MMTIQFSRNEEELKAGYQLNNQNILYKGHKLRLQYSKNTLKFLGDKREQEAIHQSPILKRKPSIPEEKYVGNADQAGSGYMKYGASGFPNQYSYGAAQSFDLAETQERIAAIQRNLMQVARRKKQEEERTKEEYSQLKRQLSNLVDWKKQQLDEMKNQRSRKKPVGVPSMPIPVADSPRREKSGSFGAVINQMTGYSASTPKKKPPIMDESSEEGEI